MLPPLEIEVTTLTTPESKVEYYPNRPERPVLLGRPLTEVFMHHLTF